MSVDSNDALVMEGDDHEADMRKREIMERLAKQMMDSSDRASKLLPLIRTSYRTTSCLVLLSAVTFCVAATEEAMLWKRENVPNAACNALKIAISALSALTSTFVIWKHSLYTKQQIISGYLPKEATLWTSGSTALVASEILFNLLHCPPYFHQTFKYKMSYIDDDIFAYYSADSIMNIFIVLRAYHIVPWLFARWHFKEAASRVQHKIGGTMDMDRLFVTKLILKEKPLVFVFYISVAACTLLSYICYSFERAYCAPWAEHYETHDDLSARCSLSNIAAPSATYENSFWGTMNLMIITRCSHMLPHDAPTRCSHTMLPHASTRMLPRILPPTHALTPTRSLPRPHTRSLPRPLAGMMNMMTTLGATLPPLTIMGRAVSTIGLISGLCLLALLLNATTQSLDFSPHEYRVHKVGESKRRFLLVFL
jgi:hypothetical protein